MCDGERLNLIMEEIFGSSCDVFSLLKQYFAGLMFVVSFQTR
jgi:hypothetical protein